MVDEYVWAAGPLKLIATPAYLERGNEQDRFTEAATMMAQVHNAFIRGFNTMWHLAPKVPTSELKNFLGYCHAVCQGLDFHHDEEEKYVFPDVERITGQFGIMNSNVEEHEAFHAGLAAFGDYLSHLLKTDPTQLDVAKFRSLFDAFSEPLQFHLQSEIDSLLALRKYSSTGLDLNKLGEEAAQRSISVHGMLSIIPAMMLNHDRTYEESYSDALWPHGIPMPVSFTVRKLATCWNWGWWKFSACTADQMPRSLPYMELPDRE